MDVTKLYERTPVPQQAGARPMGPNFKSPIVTNEKILRQVSRAFPRAEVEATKIPQALKIAATQAWCAAVGLAAIQLGFPVRFAFYDFDITEKDGAKKHVGPVYLLNPEIVRRGKLIRAAWEGCLSLPNQRFNPLRYDEIDVRNEWDGEIIKARGFEAQVIQHEIDHMDGVLCPDRQNIGRNDPCVCGSGIKVKKCCLA